VPRPPLTTSLSRQRRDRVVVVGPVEVIASGRPFNRRRRAKKGSRSEEGAICTPRTCGLAPRSLGPDRSRIQDVDPDQDVDPRGLEPLTSWLPATGRRFRDLHSELAAEVGACPHDVPACNEEHAYAFAWLPQSYRGGVLNRARGRDSNSRRWASGGAGIERLGGTVGAFLGRTPTRAARRLRSRRCCACLAE
jgi:hypothetical protein